MSKSMVKDAIGRTFFALPKIPSTVQFEITNQCNLACKMCPREVLNVKFNHMPKEMFKGIVDKLGGVDEIILTGWGEPLYHPDLMEMVAYSKKKGFATRFTTNGILLSDKIIDSIIKLKLDDIAFSVESVRPGKDEWGHLNKSALMNIEKLIKARGKRKKPQITVQVMLQKGRKKEILEVVRWAGQKGIERVNFGRLYTMFSPELKKPSVAEEKSIFAASEKIGKKYGVQIDCVQYGLFSGVPRMVYKGFKGLLHQKGKYCLKLYDYVYVNVEGKATPCCLLPHAVMGDLTTQSLKSIWNGKRFKAFRQSEPVMCANCDVMKIRQLK